jgi:tetratricopeptide (TPR) repeat protein
MSLYGKLIPYFAAGLAGFLLFFAWTAPCLAQTEAHAFISALEAYKRGDFQQAVRQWEALADGGIVNGRLYYNLGNAYLKNNDLGRALLWYERALKLIPGDPDLRFNYEYARSLTRDAQEEGPSAWARILFFWKYQLSAGTLKILALGCNLVFWMLFSAWRLTHRNGLRRMAWVAGLPALVLALTVTATYYEEAYLRQGIVLPEQVAVRSGLETTSTELFSLHAGARVRVVKDYNQHYQVHFSEDKIGWIDKDAVGLIRR